MTPLAVALSSLRVQLSFRLATVKKLQLCCAHNMPEQLPSCPELRSLVRVKSCFPPKVTAELLAPQVSWDELLLAWGYLEVAEG